MAAPPPLEFTSLTSLGASMSASGASGGSVASVGHGFALGRGSEKVFATFHASALRDRGPVHVRH